MLCRAKVIATCLIFAISMQMCCDASAIPIWEFLTRNEKMSYLYSTFAQLVSVHCKATAGATAVPVNQCKRNLLSYGYERLQTFSDAQLDAFDPYQRGANELIWSSIMRDHPNSTLITTRKPLPTPPASSIIILTHQRPTKETTHAASASATTADGDTAASQQRYPNNPIFDTDAEHKHKYAMDMDIAYGYQKSAFSQVPIRDPFESNQRDEQTPSTYLTGPLVIRVRPDGSPVEEDQYRPLPRDDDLEAFQLATPQSQAQASTISVARPKKKIATISALKQQQLQLSLPLQLQPPFEQSPSPARLRRQFHVASQPIQVQMASGGGGGAAAAGAGAGYYYGRHSASTM